MKKKHLPAPVVAQPPAAPQAGSLLPLIERAMDPTMDPSKLTALLEAKEKWEAQEARKAFTAALAAFKADPPVLTKNKRVSYPGKTGGQTEYSHATLDQVSAVIGSALTKHGLSHRWEVAQGPEGITVTCVLQHALGHSERVPMTAPADSSGSKNSIQAIGSTVTYLQRYTLLAATGMAVKGQDDDGAGGPKMDEGKFADFLAAIDGAGSGDELKQIFGKAWNAADKARDSGAKRLFTQHKDARKTALGLQ